MKKSSQTTQRQEDIEATKEVIVPMFFNFHPETCGR